MMQKVVVSVCIGDNPDAIEKIKNTLEKILQQKLKFGIAKKTIRQWEVRRGRPISVFLTLRGDKTKDFLYKGLCAKEFQLKDACVTPQGHLNFGVAEHIDLGIKYDPGVGIFGMNFAVVLRKKGHRVLLRKRKRSRLGNGQKVSKEETRDWLVKNF